MPTADDIARWRAEAKSLRVGVIAGDDAALARVLVAHPKYVGRPPQRLNTNRIRFSLTDAQLTIAREHEHDNWSALCDQGRRWPHRTMGSQYGRAVRIALERGDGHCGAEHLLLALASPPRPTIASEVLESIGADIGSLRSRPANPAPSGGKGVATNPRCARCVSSAVTFAIAQGADRVTDEHVLLAFAYTEPDVLHGVSADPDEIYDELAARGVPVPATRPPASPNRPGPSNPKLCVRRADLNAVLRVLRAKHPPGSASWGFSYSTTNPDEAYVISEDEIDIEAVAREALGPDGVFRFGPRQDSSSD
jgi:hypothetical protein